MMMKIGLKPGDAIRHPWMTKAVEKAQKRVEEHNFEIRKNLIKYDEVMNQQREVIYSYRRSVLKGYDLKAEILDMIAETIENTVNDIIPADSYPEDWNLERVCMWFKNSLNLGIEPSDLESDHLNRDLLLSTLTDFAMRAYEHKEASMGAEQLRNIERRALLEVVDDEWRDHLHEMDLLKDGVHLRSYANKDPLIEYKKESFELFQSLISRIQENVTKKVFTTYILSQAQMDDMLKHANMSHADMNAFLHAQEQAQQFNQNMSAPPQFNNQAEEKQRPIRVAAKVGRNDPCPCGSGKKYKKCCGQHEEMED